MKNEDRLLEFIRDRAGGENEVSLSAYQIANEWKLKQKVKTIVITTEPSEKAPSRFYVYMLINQLQDKGKIIYKTNGTNRPTIKIL